MGNRRYVVCVLRTDFAVLKGTPGLSRWALVKPTYAMVDEAETPHGSPTLKMKELDELKDIGISEAERIALEASVWWKLDRWVLPVCTMFYLLSFLVRFPPDPSLSPLDLRRARRIGATSQTLVLLECRRP